MPGFVNKSISFNSDNELHMNAMKWAEEQGFSGFVRSLIIGQYLRDVKEIDAIVEMKELNDD